MIPPRRLAPHDVWTALILLHPSPAKQYPPKNQVPKHTEKALDLTPEAIVVIQPVLVI